MMKNLLRIRKKFFNFFYKDNYPKFDYDLYLQSLKKEKTLRGNSSLIVSWDDLSFPLDTVPYDYGHKIGNGTAWDLFFSFVNKNSDIKHLIFWIPKPSFKYYSDFSSFDFGSCKLNKSFILSKLELLNFSKINYQLCVHGVNHNRLFPLDRFPSMEFDYIDSLAIKEKIDKNMDIFEFYSLISGKDIHFKPPAWSIGQRDNKFRGLDYFLNHSLFKFLYIISPSTSQLDPLSKFSVIHKSRYKEKIIIPQNINLTWDMDRILEIVDIILFKGGIIHPQLHFISGCEFIQDGINLRNLNKLQNIIDYYKHYK